MFIFMLIAIFSFEYFGENAIIPQVVTSMAYFLQANVTSYMFNTNVTFYYKLHFRWRYLNVLIQWEVRTLFFFSNRYQICHFSGQCQIYKLSVSSLKISSSNLIPFRALSYCWYQLSLWGDLHINLGRINGCVNLWETE